MIYWNFNRFYYFQGYNIEVRCKAGDNKVYREQTISNITQLVEDEEYHCRCKNGFPGVFSRGVQRSLELNRIALPRQFDE